MMPTQSKTKKIFQTINDMSLGMTQKDEKQKPNQKNGSSNLKLIYLEVQLYSGQPTKCCNKTNYITYHYNLKELPSLVRNLIIMILL